MRTRDAGRRWRLVTCAVGALAVMAPRLVRGQELRASQAADLAVTLAGTGAWMTSQDVREDLVPSRCRWCDRTGGVDELNALDREARRLRWKRKSQADTLSDFAVAATLVGGVASSAVAAGHGGAHELGSDAMAVAEAGVLAADLNQLVKLVAMRERPDAHALALAEPGRARSSVEDDLSFCSGHTTETVALAVAAGTVSSLHGYKLAPLVWSVALPLAAATGYLRIAADRHYLTDVLAGAVLGAAVGFLVPYALHQPAAPPSAGMGAPSPTSQGYSLAFSGVW